MVSLGFAVVAGFSVGSPNAPAVTGDAAPAYTATKTITRDHLVANPDGSSHIDQVVDTRTVTVSADVTSGLRDRQAVNISWSGAHPTGGVVYDNSSSLAARQEYPVAVLQCRGVDSATAPASQRVTPETCFTQTPDLRYQGPGSLPSTAYRVDRYASAAQRGLRPGQPSPRPAACEDLDPTAPERWVPFIAADGKQYSGGAVACAAKQLSPDQTLLQNPLALSSAVWGTTDKTGKGTAKLFVETAQTNASLGCSDTVACSIVVIPIIGISCDADGALVSGADVPTDPAAAFKDCSQTGNESPGLVNDGTPSLTDTGLLWWSESNWRNRFSVPITLAQSATACDIFGSSNGSENIYGAQSLLQATQQWAPPFCLDKSLFTLTHVQQSEIIAKNLLAGGLANGTYAGAKAIFQAAPPGKPFGNPVVQAPTAISGFAIGYSIDGANGQEYKSLKLNARLLAKLLTSSYPGDPYVKSDWKSCCNAITDPPEPNYGVAANNPLEMMLDPEFLALNPGLVDAPPFNQLESSATLFTMSGQTDVITAVTSYIKSDPDARAFLDGSADPWGMVVNPSYRNISLPVNIWTQRDTHFISTGGSNQCIDEAKTPVLPQIAGPVADPGQVVTNLQLNVNNAQTNCVDLDAGVRRLTAVGREDTGLRFLLGLVSLADADRYGLNVASLQTQRASTAPDKFTDLTGRSFAAPDEGGLKAAAQMLSPDATLGTWSVPYDKLRTDPAGAAAYPGTMLISTDVPSKYLPAKDATNLSKFLKFVAGPGQVPGLQNGQLAPGYLPITAANGLGQLASYTAAAADAVAAQQGAVPSLTGAVPPSSVTATSPPVSLRPAPGFTPALVPPVRAPSASPSVRRATPIAVATRATRVSPPRPSTTSSPPAVTHTTGVTNQPGSSYVNPPAANNPGATSASAVIASPHASVPAAHPVVSAPLSTAPAALTGSTAASSAGPLGLALPVLLLLAVGTALASAVVGRFGRR